MQESWFSVSQSTMFSIHAYNLLRIISQQNCQLSSCFATLLMEVCSTFIHSGYFYIASSSPLLLRGSPDTARILCRSFTLKHHRQLRVKDLPKVPTWRLKWDSDPSDEMRRIYQWATTSHKSFIIYAYLMHCSCNSFRNSHWSEKFDCKRQVCQIYTYLHISTLHF